MESGFSQVTQNPSALAGVPDRKEGLRRKWGAHPGKTGPAPGHPYSSCTGSLEAPAQTLPKSPLLVAQGSPAVCRAGGATRVYGGATAWGVATEALGAKTSFPITTTPPGPPPCSLSSPPPPLKQVVLLPYLKTGRLPAQLRVGKQGPSHPQTHLQLFPARAHGHTGSRRGRNPGRGLSVPSAVKWAW